MALKAGGEINYFSCIMVYSQAKNITQSQVVGRSASNIGDAILGEINASSYWLIIKHRYPIFIFYFLFLLLLILLFSITYCILHSILFDSTIHQLLALYWKCGYLIMK